MRKSPVDEVEQARKFYVAQGHEVGHFAALWHSFNVGHMLATNLNQICRNFDLSIADLNLLGALGVEQQTPLRTSDLAMTLQVSNGALSNRIENLERKGLLLRTASEHDRRAFTLTATEAGKRKVESVHEAIARDSHFVQAFNRLSEDDREALERIMGTLHTALDRTFTHVHR